jgi:integrase/recombinase XerD
MLTTYFKRRATVAAYESGPAGADLDPFTAWLAKRGYGSDAVRHLLRGATEFATWAQAPISGLTLLPSGYWRDFCEHLAKRKRMHGSRGQHSIYWRGAQQFVEFLRAQHGVIAFEAPERTVAPELVVAFERWMAVHRGIKPSSLDTYRPHILSRPSRNQKSNTMAAPPKAR